MKKNMGTLDRAIRTLIAIAIAVLYFTDRISGTVAIVLVHSRGLSVDQRRRLVPHLLAAWHFHPQAVIISPRPCARGRAALRVRNSNLFSGQIAAGSIQNAAHVFPSGSAMSRVYMKPRSSTGFASPATVAARFIASTASRLSIASESISRPTRPMADR